MFIELAGAFLCILKVEIRQTILLLFFLGELFIKLAFNYSPAPQEPPTSVPAPPLHRPAAPSSPGLARAKLGQKHRMKQGRRSQQRAENDRLLMAMYGIDSEEAVQGGDIQQETRSYFVDLLDAGTNLHIVL